MRKILSMSCSIHVQSSITMTEDSEDTLLLCRPWLEGSPVPVDVRSTTFLFREVEFAGDSSSEIVMTGVEFEAEAFPLLVREGDAAIAAAKACGIRPLRCVGLCAGVVDVDVVVAEEEAGA